MVSIEEVRARVQAAAQRQIQARAERAGEVAQAWQEVATKRAELDVVTVTLASAVKSALEVMNPDELAEFAGVPKSDVQAHAQAGQTAVRKTRRRRAPATRTARTAQPEQRAEVTVGEADNA